MNTRALLWIATAFCVTVVGCATPPLKGPIINPAMIDQTQADEKFLAKYCDVVVKADAPEFGVFGVVTAMCRKILAGDLTLAGVKNSQNGRYRVYMFKDKVSPAGSAKGNYAIAAYSFDPGAGLMRACNSEGRCHVYVRNGTTRFGYSNIDAHGEPTVNDKGVSVKFNDDRSYAFDFLFSYGAGNKQDGEELISIFLSAFPVLGYE